MSEPPRKSLMKKPLEITFQTMRRHLRLILAVTAVLWAIELLDLVKPGASLDWYGIHPRTLMGLRNIVIAPFLHAGFGHLIANTLPLIALGLLVLSRGPQDFASVSLVSLLVSGLGVWLLGGANTVHLGASGVIFGYLGYLLAAGWWERSPRALLLAAAVLLVYGGMLPGVLPGREGVSWLAHLFGLLGGILAAHLIRNRATATA